MRHHRRSLAGGWWPLRRAGHGAVMAGGNMAWPASLEERVDLAGIPGCHPPAGGRYSLSLDMLVMDAHVNLSAPDIRGEAKTRAARTSRPMTDTAAAVHRHLAPPGPAPHRLADADYATGVVQFKNEHECGAEWVIMQMLYRDTTSALTVSGTSAAAVKSTSTHRPEQATHKDMKMRRFAGNLQRHLP